MTLLDLPYQTDGASFLASRKAALLADEPGLGKTLQAIRACDEVQALFVLVICPAGVVENWKREIQKFRTGDWQAFVTSYDKAAGSDFHKIICKEWCVLIIDEGHYLKTLTTKRTKSIYGKSATLEKYCIARMAKQVFVLTGTPMPNAPTELYPHLRALYPEAVKSEKTGQPWTYHQFMAHYCVLKSNGFGQQIVGSKNEAKLNAKLEGFMLRRRKADVLKELPPLRVAELWLDGDVSGVEFEEAEQVRAVLAEEGIAGLKRLAYDGGVAKLRRLLGMAKAAPAAQWINDWLDSTPPEMKLVVFFHHYDVGEFLYDKLHVRAVRVHGGIKQKERQAAVDRLQNDPAVRVFLGQMTAAGTGITLTAASDMLILESSWVPAEVQQAAMRIHRIGQERPCLVRFGMVAGSLDEDIQQALMRKMSSISKVIDGEEHGADRSVLA